MNYVFATETRGYNPGMTDYWRCRTAGQSYDNCDYNGLSIDYSNRANARCSRKPPNLWFRRGLVAAVRAGFQC